MHPSPGPTGEEVIAEGKERERKRKRERKGKNRRESMRPEGSAKGELHWDIVLSLL